MDTGQSIFSHSSGEILMSECLKTQHDHFLRILFCEYGTFMVVDKLFESILILTGYFSDVHILARPGVFADMDF